MSIPVAHVGGGAFFFADVYLKGLYECNERVVTYVASKRPRRISCAQFHNRTRTTRSLRWMKTRRVPPLTSTTIMQRSRSTCNLVHNQPDTGWVTPFSWRGPPARFGAICFLSSPRRWLQSWLHFRHHFKACCRAFLPLRHSGLCWYKPSWAAKCLPCRICGQASTPQHVENFSPVHRYLSLQWLFEQICVRYISRKDESFLSVLDSIMLSWHTDSLSANYMRDACSTNIVKGVMNYLVTFQLKYKMLFIQPQTSNIGHDEQSSQFIQGSIHSTFCPFNGVSKLFLKTRNPSALLERKPSEVAEAMSIVLSTTTIQPSFCPMRILQTGCSWLRAAAWRIALFSPCCT